MDTGPELSRPVLFSLLRPLNNSSWLIRLLVEADPELASWLGVESNRNGRACSALNPEPGSVCPTLTTSVTCRFQRRRGGRPCAKKLCVAAYGRRDKSPGRVKVEARFRILRLARLRGD